MSKVIEILAGAVEARLNCLKSGNEEWRIRHEDTIHEIEKNYLPSGSGFDNGTSVDLEMSTGVKLVLDTSFHHMGEHGCYDGWTEHDVVVTPTFRGFDTRVTGRDRNEIKDHIADAFAEALGAEYIKR